MQLCVYITTKTSLRGLHSVENIHNYHLAHVCLEWWAQNQRVYYAWGSSLHRKLQEWRHM